MLPKNRNIHLTNKEVERTGKTSELKVRIDLETIINNGEASLLFSIGCR